MNVSANRCALRAADEDRSSYSFNPVRGRHDCQEWAVEHSVTHPKNSVRRFSVYVAMIICSPFLAKNALADAFVPVVAVLELPFAIISVFWIAPLEAALVRLREPATTYGTLLWDFWLANWISLLAGIGTCIGIFGLLAALEFVGVYAHFPWIARSAEFIRPFEPDDSHRSFLTVFLVSLGWAVLTLPVTIVVEARFLRRRWGQRCELMIRSPLLHSTVVNCVSYALLLGGLSVLFLRK